MSTVSAQDRENFGYDLFGEIADWIAVNITPSAIYEDWKLVEDVMDNMWDFLVDTINNEKDPEDVFDEEILHEWAIRTGRIEPQET